MKTIYCNILYLIFLIPVLSLGNNDRNSEGKYSKEKSLKKEYNVTSDALLKINNDYGNLDITSWNENKIVLEISIKVNGNDEETVIQKLKSIDVLFDVTDQLVSAKTIFDKEGKSWWQKISDSWGNNNVKVEINYHVKVPISNRIDLNNDYGSITLDKIEGHAKIHCDYGQIIIGELLGTDNYINIDYTHNSTIKYMKSGEINADYSDFTIEKSENLKLNADYTQSAIGIVKNLNYNCDYGGLKIKNVGSLKGNGDYLNTDIDTVSKEIYMNSDYGSIDIINLKSTAKNVTIKTDYTGVDIGYEPSYNFDFIIKTSYGNIDMEDDVDIMKKNKENTSKEYEGYNGQKNSGNKIDITTSYGSVKLKKNNH